MREKQMMRGVSRESLVACIAGLALGIVTRVADSQEFAITWLGSLLAPWAMVAFGVGTRSPTWPRSVILSTVAMASGVAAYYGWWQLMQDGTRLGSFLGFWLLLAPVAGIVFGLAGWTWRFRPFHWLFPTVAVALTGGIIAGESIFMVLTARTLSDGEVTILSGVITLGLLMPLVLLRGRRDRLTGFGLTVGFLLAGAASVRVIRWLVEVIR